MPNETKRAAFELFETGAGVEQIAAATGRAPSTVWGYLAEFVATRRPPTLDPWVDAATHRLVAEAVQQVGSSYLKPIFDRLHGRVPYEHIRLVVAHLGHTRTDDAGETAGGGHPTPRP